MTRRHVAIGLAVFGGTVVAVAGGVVLVVSVAMGAADRYEEAMSE